jgi:hypothetical protein
MPNAAFERLQTLGSFGLTFSKRFEIVSRRMGRGRRRSLLYGDRAGLHSIKLVFKTLPDTMDRPVETTPAQIETEANYLWNFFCRSKTGYDDIDHPFVVKNLRDGKDYLCVFTGNEISYEMFMTKLYSSGLDLEQVTLPDVNTLDDGSLGEADNPQEI